MKQKDIVLIAVIIFVSAIISYFISNALLAKPKDRQQEVEVVQVITAEFKEADRKYFNEQAFDPTTVISIGQNTNPTPFSGSPQ
jgi:hypothetical protein